MCDNAFEISGEKVLVFDRGDKRLAELIGALRELGLEFEERVEYCG
jgi:hypothetical protein